MSESTNSISFVANYYNTDETRGYVIADVAASVLPYVKTKVTNINASLAGGTADSLANIFVSDDYDVDDGTGKLIKISNVVIKSVTETEISQ